MAETPSFERRDGEGDKSYYGRVEMESNEFMKIARFEDGNECKTVKNDKGQIEVVKKVRRKQVKNKE